MEWLAREWLDRAVEIGNSKSSALVVSDMKFLTVALCILRVVGSKCLLFPVGGVLN